VEHQPVKLGGIPRTRIAGWLSPLVVLGALTGTLAAGANQRSILLGGTDVAVEPRRAPLDPRIPRGAQQYIHKRPETATIPSCSPTWPVCVHVPPAQTAPQVDLLHALETAYALATQVGGFPPPVGDGAAGGSDALDFYLEAAAPLTVAVEPTSWPRNTSAAFCMGDAQGEGSVARTAAVCVHEAILAGLNSAATPHHRRAAATHLWRELGGMATRDVEQVDDVQARPDRSIARRDVSADSGGASIWFDYLERKLGARRPGAVTLALFGISRTGAAPGQWRYENDPDLLDVLRHSVGGRPTDVADLAIDFAIARALAGRRFSGNGPLDLRWAGPGAEVRFDWRIALSSLPRRVINDVPLEALGATYLWLDLDESATKSTLGFEATWESPVSFKWALVKLDANGRELSRIDVPFLEQGRSVRRTVADLSDAKSILVVGTNLGGVDAAHPFDPDYEPWEPHRCTIYLARL